MIIAGNWKLNKSPYETKEFLQELITNTNNGCDGDFIVFPPQVSLMTCSDLLNESNIQWGAQNICTQESGAFTGETSVKHIKEMGGQYTLIGHSERRSLYFESNEDTHKKLTLTLAQGVKAMLCIGETLEQRNQGETKAVLEKQISEAFAGMASLDTQKILLAYEPVWAIGTGVVATKEQVAETHADIRSILATKWDQNTASSMKILYGGSVKPANCKELGELNGVDGFLIGGASLKTESFCEINQLTKT